MMTLDYTGMFEKVAAITARRISSNAFSRRLDAKAAFEPPKKYRALMDDGKYAIDFSKTNPHSSIRQSVQADAVTIANRLRVNYGKATRTQIIRSNHPNDITKSQLYKKPRHIRLADKGYGRFLPADTRKLGETRSDAYDRLFTATTGIGARATSFRTAAKEAIKHKWNTSPTFRANVGGTIGQSIALASNLF